MPARLTLPLELHRLVLSHETTAYSWMWGSCRLGMWVPSLFMPILTALQVCKVWQEQVEFLAKTEWTRNTTFDYPGEMRWFPKHGQVYLDGEFTFQRLEGDLAIFQQTDCDPDFREALAEVCQAAPRPDVEVGEIIHDVEIDGMSV
ncbi:hypothetical protein B0H17DRAFT_1093457, partial [Mycena rosella]